MILKIRVSEHKKDLLLNDQRNALVTHRDETGHNFDLIEAKSIKQEHAKKRRQIIESALIANINTIKQQKGFHNLSRGISRLIIAENGLFTYTEKTPNDLFPT